MKSSAVELDPAVEDYYVSLQTDPHRFILAAAFLCHSLYLRKTKKETACWPYERELIPAEASSCSALYLWIASSTSSSEQLQRTIFSDGIMLKFIVWVS
jgi:hypothetical protein